MRGSIRGGFASPNLTCCSARPVTGESARSSTNVPGYVWQRGRLYVRTVDRLRDGEDRRAACGSCRMRLVPRPWLRRCVSSAQAPPQHVLGRTATHREGIHAARDARSDGPGDGQAREPRQGNVSSCDSGGLEPSSERNRPAPRPLRQGTRRRPQAVAWRLPCLFACAKIPVEIAAARTTVTKNVTGSAGVTSRTIRDDVREDLSVGQLLVQ
jgi:hypothetical protein